MYSYKIVAFYPDGRFLESFFSVKSRSDMIVFVRGFVSASFFDIVRVYNQKGICVKSYKFCCHGRNED